MSPTPPTTPAPRAEGRAGGAAPAWRRVAAQGAFEARLVLRNGEQLLVILILPALLLVTLARTSLVEIELAGGTRIDAVVPGILTLAVMSTAFTSQAIATSFDRRNGVLRLLATTPLGRGGLLAGKVLAVLAVEAVQVVLLGGVALALGWSPPASGLAPALLAIGLGTAAFTAFALLLAGVLRAEAVLAVANLVLVLLAVGGGALIPADQLPGALADLAPLLPSGALGVALRGALHDGALPLGATLVLAAWTAALGGAAGRLFRWS
ncbi:ABC transporter permease [Pengzhenrongella sicca]|uniref:ABC transporter permease n=2 Tax=Pengzhenrongella sicca TaxID=2819238 RepID=A0A8A4ZLK2_9MICO|nr:ABC transporter permease [Pengzhenrongella sicca]QTE31386.1 ABC transporter permease [Pengzhenrongella sicca]